MDEKPDLQGEERKTDTEYIKERTAYGIFWKII